MLYLRVATDRMYAVHADHTVSVFKWNTIPDNSGRAFLCSSSAVTRLRAESIGVIAFLGSYISSF